MPAVFEGLQDGLRGGQMNERMGAQMNQWIHAYTDAQIYKYRDGEMAGQAYAHRQGINKQSTPAVPSKNV